MLQNLYFFISQLFFFWLSENVFNFFFCFDFFLWLFFLWFRLFFFNFWLGFFRNKLFLFLFFSLLNQRI
ncbi:MAG: hypothetical protein DRH57_00335 [Candidatus Cloacimonadota bacterium]|nr:MAG: hypothetical protein DRH57_00335 [Candidatus Cloacimonadota bacterium]